MSGGGFALALALALAASTTPASAQSAPGSLCLRVTVNDLPAGAETRLRLSREGHVTWSGRARQGRARFAPLAAGKWRLTVQHPKMRPWRGTLTVSGATALHLDCGHADEWSGCQINPISDGCQTAGRQGASARGLVARSRADAVLPVPVEHPHIPRNGPTG